MIGKLDQRVTLQTHSLAADGIGGQVATWATLATVWANVRPASARETLSVDGMAATGLYVFTIRNRSDLGEAARAVWGGENYNIRGIRRRGGRELYLEFEAERGAADVG